MEASDDPVTMVSLDGVGQTTGHTTDHKVRPRRIVIEGILALNFTLHLVHIHSL